MNQYKVTIKRAWKDDDGPTVLDAVLDAGSTYAAAAKALRPFKGIVSDPARHERPLVITVVSVL